METNRAKAVAMNAEIRRSKARLLEDVAKLQKLGYKKVYFTPNHYLHLYYNKLTNHGIFRSQSICQ